MSAVYRIHQFSYQVLLTSTRMHSLRLRVLCALSVETSTTFPRLLGSPLLLDKVIQAAFFRRILHAIFLIEPYAVHGVIFALSRAMEDV